MFNFIYCITDPKNFSGHEIQTKHKCQILNFNYKSSYINQNTLLLQNVVNKVYFDKNKSF